MNIDPAEIRALVRMVTQRTGAPLHDEDLEQDATLRAMEALRKRLEIRYPRAFLLKVVQDAVHDHWRRRRSTDDLGSLDETRFALLPRPEDDIDRQRRTDLLHRALQVMDREKRATIELYYLQDLSIAEIGRIKNKSVSAVKMDLLRGRRLLRRIVRTLATKKSP